ncbi:carbohydrate kinase family protein [Anaerolentibacter hominis]|uniref:carbohydrate kinase family protein n=1 Tax=Anaerolentibacter hominis TaxID=3079009 RepID=UPI0031B8ACFE
MERQYDVISIGFIAQDILMTNIPKDALERDASTADQVIFSSGGDANNEAVTLARLGDKAALLVKIGTDTVGNTIYDGLSEEPLDLSLIIRDDRARMPLAICVIQPDGNRSFLLGMGKDYFLTLEDVDLSLVQKARAITVGSLFSLERLDHGGITAIFKEARKYGTITIADMTADLKKIGPEAISDVYPYTDFMMPSLEEATYVTGETDPDKIADWFLAAGVKNVVLKLGGDGCFVKNAQERFYTDPFQIEPVDTTGCGDNFVAGFTHCLIRGKSLRECADFACGVGALNALGIGAHLTVKSEQHVLDFMNSTPRAALNRG